MITRHVEAILLDIEGTTSSVAFVYDVMFPYVQSKLHRFLQTKGATGELQSIFEQMAIDLGHTSASEWYRSQEQDDASAVSVVEQTTDAAAVLTAGDGRLDFFERQVLRLMAADSKTTGLKKLQGWIWEEGFTTGELQSHFFPDVVPALKRWREDGLSIGIYSSGSILAQKLFFGHTPFGDLRPLISRHYDTTTGPKRDPLSYQRIAEDWGLAPTSILFLSDVAQELLAATSHQMQAIAVVRPGNAPLPSDYPGEAIHTFDELRLLRE